MNITLISPFRNAIGYIERYFNQVDRLRDMLTGFGHDFFGIWGEGDSTDKTQRYIHLFQYDFNLAGVVVDCTHGGPAFGSVVDPQRFLQCAYACNLLLMRIPQDADIVVWADSDIEWEPETILNLIDATKEYPAIAPLVLLRREGWPADSFYNTFDFRIDGKHFTHEPPYHPKLDGITQVDSAGSVLVMRGDLARKVHFTAQSVIVGLCAQIYQNGGSVWIEPKSKCFHR